MGDYTYAVEYFDSDSSGSQWQTYNADCVAQAVKQFKLDNPLARVYNVFVQHRDADDFYEGE